MARGLIEGGGRLMNRINTSTSAITLKDDAQFIALPHGSLSCADFLIFIVSTDKVCDVNGEATMAVV